MEMPRRPRARRILIIGIVSTFAAVGILFFQHCYLARPIGVGPAGPSVPREAFRSSWSNRDVILLGIGDSVTAGYGAPPEKSFMARLAENPPDEFSEMQGICLKSVLPQLRVCNVAVSGSNSLQHAEKMIPGLKPFPKEVYGIVIMTTGGNDLIHWYGTRPPMEGAMYGATLQEANPWIANYERRVNRMLEDISLLFPGGCTIFLGNIYDPSDGGADPRLAGLPPWKDLLAIHAAYNHSIARCVRNHPNTALVDLESAFRGHGVRCAQFWRDYYHPEDPCYWYYENIEDPNERGHDAIRRLFLLKIVEKLGTQASPLHQS